MLPFSYSRAAGVQDAVHAAAAMPAGAPSAAPVAAAAQFLAGGTQLMDLMKLGAMHAEMLVDVNDLQATHGRIGITPQGLHLGALARMSDAAANPDILKDYPVIAQSLALAASPQIRNMASLGGNVLQRTRCQYFREPSYDACNKRNPGSGCAALDGVNRKHAVLGVGPRCIAAYPGDFAQALIALGADVHTQGDFGTRHFPFADLHTGPERPEVETILRQGELITHFTVPAGPWTRRSLYLKIRDRQSYAFGLSTAAVALHMQDDAVVEARIALGGVAYRPWRAHEAEAGLRGKPVTRETAETAARAALSGATPRRGNAYMVELGQRTVARALLAAARLAA